MTYGKHSYYESPKDEQHRRAKEQREHDAIAFLERRRQLDAKTKHVLH